MDSICVLVPFYEAESVLAEGFLDRLLSVADGVERADVRVLTIDDASTDGTLDRLLAYRDRVDVLSHDENLDYACAMNDLVVHGLDAHDPSAFLFLSQDARMDAAAIDALVSILDRDPELDVLQPLVRDERGGIYSFGHRYNDYCMVHPISRPHTTWEPWADRPYVPRPSVSLLGTVVRSEVFETVGLLDERFEHYWESSDVSFRARRAGGRVGATDRAVAYHERYLEESTPEQLYYSYRNWPLFWAKYDESVSDDVIEEYWPGEETSVPDVTEDIEECEDASFLDRARADAREMRPSFRGSVDFGRDEIDDGRVTVHR